MSCEICHKSFKTIRLLKQHERIHNTICERCNISFESNSNLRQHIRESHPKLKDIKCRVCPKLAFFSEKEYLLHVRDSHEGKIIESHMCSDCGKTFRTGSELSLHMKSKCGTEKQYICKECGKKMMSPGSLYTHLKRHKGNLNFMCRFCAKCFLTSGQLKVHERKHTKQKDFVCDICNKGFCHRQSLITHISVHTGIKPYQCEGCGKSFSCISNLLKHRKSHKTTCGLLPMTSHRVKNPATKIKLLINTPESSKLKRAQMKKELQMKFACLDEEMKKETDKDTVLEKTETGSGNTVEEENPDVTHGSKKLRPEKSFATETKIKLDESDEEKFDDNQTSNEIEIPILENALEARNEVDNLSIDMQPQKNDDASITSEEQYSPKKRERKRKPQRLDDEEVFSENIKCELKTDHFDVEDVFESDNESEEEYKPHNQKRKGKTRPHRRRSQLLDSDIQKFIRERNLVKGEMGHCQYCSKGYTSFGCLYKHEQEHLKSDTNCKESKPASFKCSCCKMIFETSEQVKQHQQANHADVLTCPDCPERKFARPDHLRLHRETSHEGPAAVAAARKRYVYVCDKCGREFRAKCLLDHHETADCGRNPTDWCAVCAKSFANRYTLKAHMVVHSAEKRLACAFCGKSFHWKGQLKVHERSHTGEKPYACLFCPSSFAYRDSLIRHSSLHTGVKPYLCKCCGWRFSCIGNLIKHKATHSTTCGAWYEDNEKGGSGDGGVGDH